MNISGKTGMRGLTPLTDGIPVYLLCGLALARKLRDTHGWVGFTLLASTPANAS